MFQVGPYTFDHHALLAPMAGVTDAPFRQLCLQHGAALATSEMITSDTRLWNSRKTRSRLLGNDSCNSQPVSIQIAGSEPAMMADAAQQAVAMGAQIIDINMGCPAKKVCKKLAGSALLQDESLVASILTAVVNSVSVPVTLKTRTGWAPARRNGNQIARIAEDTGIRALAVHGRTRECRFNGTAEYDTIASIVDSVSIPVIANGDIDSPEKTRQVLEHTGAAAVMIGRGALGNPWIFEQTEYYLKHGKLRAQPSHQHIQETLSWHLEELSRFYGETQGVRIARKHTRWYLQRLPGAEPFLKLFNQLNSLHSQLEAVTQFFARPETHEEKAA